MMDVGGVGVGMGCKSCTSLYRLNKVTEALRYGANVTNRQIPPMYVPLHPQPESGGLS